MFFVKQKVIFFSSFCIFFVSILSAQAKIIRSDRFYPITIHSNYYPFIFPTNFIMSESLKGERYGYSADISSLYVNKSIWKFWHFYPEIGLSFNHYCFGKNKDNSKVTGIGGLLYVEPKFNYFVQNYLTTRIGIGAIELKNIPYSISQKGNFIGKHNRVLFHLIFGWKWYYKLNKYGQINLGLNYNYIPFEIENNIKKNDNKDVDLQWGSKSLSFLSAYLGANFTFNPSNSKDYYINNYKKCKSYLTIAPLFSLKEYKDKKYSIISLFGKYSRQCYKNTYTTLTLEIAQDFNTKAYMKDMHMARLQSLKIKMFVGAEYLYGIFIPSFQLGCFLFTLDKRDEPVYLSIPLVMKQGLHIKITKKFGIGIHANFLPIGKKGLFTYIDTQYALAYIF